MNSSVFGTTLECHLKSRNVFSKLKYIFFTFAHIRLATYPLSIWIPHRTSYSQPWGEYEINYAPLKLIIFRDWLYLEIPGIPEESSKSVINYPYSETLLLVLNTPSYSQNMNTIVFTFKELTYIWGYIQFCTDDLTSEIKLPMDKQIGRYW